MFLFQVGFTSNNNVMLKNTKLFIYTMILLGLLTLEDALQIKEDYLIRALN